jgi:surfeit locus 1 family protein
MTPRARSVLVGAVTLLACAACVRLGVWQWQRWHASALDWERFERGAGVLQPLGARTLADVALYQRVSVAGSLDAAHQFLLDNRSYRGRAGYEVLTPLTRADGRVLLVDRGWVAFTGTRARLPEVALDTAATVTLSGRVAQLPSAGLASGRAAPRAADPWPKVTSFPRPGELAQALGVPLEMRILLLDAQAPFGLVRDWQPPGMSPLRHLAYAIQWWCFAALALIVWAVLGLKRVARRD